MSESTAYAPLDQEASLWSHDVHDIGDPAERDLLIMLHGWSYDETHLFALRDQLPDSLVVASLRAPYAEAGGYAWFPSRGNPIGNPQPAVANAAALRTLEWLDTLPPFRSVGALGFSQGGAMALQLLRHRPRHIAYVVQLAGFVVDDKQVGDPQLLARRPPVFWGRGELDTVIPASALRRTNEFLAAHTDLHEKTYRGLGHDVRGNEVTDFSTFVARCVGER